MPRLPGQEDQPPFPVRAEPLGSPVRGEPVEPRPLLAHESRGTGSRVTLLLHGFLGSRKNLASLARRWAERDPTRAFVLVDLTGHGDSPALPAEPTLNDLATDLLALAHTLSPNDPVDLVGHSMGGRTAMKCRMVEPRRVRSLTVLDIAPSPIDESTNSLMPVLQALLDAPANGPDRRPFRDHFAARGLTPALIDWLLMNLVPDPTAPADAPRLRWRFDRAALAALHANTRNEDLWPAFEEHQHDPSLCVRGERSRFVTELDTLRYERAGTRVVTIPGAGHFLHVDAQEALLAALVG